MYYKDFLIAPKMFSESTLILKDAYHATVKIPTYTDNTAVDACAQ